MRDPIDYPRAADLFNDLEPEPAKRWTEVMPGLIVAALATMAAGFVADHYGAPLTLMALLIGLALNFLGADPRMASGLGFASRTLLRWGIVLVGARVTIGQIVALGPMTLLAVVLILLATLAVGALVARAMGLSAAFGTLAGGSVAICGASAALALATTLGDRRVNQAQLALVLVGISAASATAMFFYPLIAHAAGLSDRQPALVYVAPPVGEGEQARAAMQEMMGKVANFEDPFFFQRFADHWDEVRARALDVERRARDSKAFARELPGFLVSRGGQAGDYLFFPYEGRNGSCTLAFTRQGELIDAIGCEQI